MGECLPETCYYTKINMVTAMFLRATMMVESHILENGCAVKEKTMVFSQGQMVMLVVSPKRGLTGSIVLDLFGNLVNKHQYDAAWMAQFEELKAFKQKYNSTKAKVLATGSDDPITKVGNWVGDTNKRIQQVHGQQDIHYDRREDRIAQLNRLFMDCKTRE